jgi:hypothetical protein
MLAKWVLEINGIDGWDFFARVFKICGIVKSMPMVVALVVAGVRRSTDMSRGHRQGWLGRRCKCSCWMSSFMRTRLAKGTRSWRMEKRESRI